MKMIRLFIVIGRILSLSSTVGYGNNQALYSRNRALKLSSFSMVHGHRNHKISVTN